MFPSQSVIPRDLPLRPWKRDSKEDPETESIRKSSQRKALGGEENLENPENSPEKWIEQNFSSFKERTTKSSISKLTPPKKSKNTKAKHRSKRTHVFSL